MGFPPSHCQNFYAQLPLIGGTETQDQVKSVGHISLGRMVFVWNSLAAIDDLRKAMIGPNAQGPSSTRPTSTGKPATIVTRLKLTKVFRNMLTADVK